MSKLVLDEEEAKNRFLLASMLPSLLLLPANQHTTAATATTVVLSSSHSAAAAGGSSGHYATTNMSPPKSSISSNMDRSSTCCGLPQQYYSSHTSRKATHHHHHHHVLVLFLLLAVLVGVHAAPSPRLPEPVASANGLEAATKSNVLTTTPERKHLGSEFALANKHRTVPSNPMANCSNNLAAILEMICPSVRKDILKRIRLSALGKGLSRWLKCIK